VALPLDAPAAGDNFGSRVAISGNTILVGGPGNTASHQGKVQVFVASEGEWLYQTTLSDVGALRFGTGVALDGNTAVVGAPGSNTAYVYGGAGSAWTSIGQMTGTGGFGFDVQLSGESAVVGMQSGPSAYVFTASDNWDDAEILGSGDYFGHSVGISDTAAVVGDYWRNTAYFYRLDGGNWVADGSVSRGSTGSSNQFGYSVAIDGDYAIVGANQTGAGSLTKTGSATIYRREADATWVEQITLAPDELYDNDQFGYSVAIDGDFAAIGAINQGSWESSWSGSVYVYQRVGSTWIFTGKLQPENGTIEDQFGCSVAIGDGKIVVGSWHEDLDDLANDNAGAAYVFDIPTLFFLPGDANFDGHVNEVDAKILADRWGLANGATWGDGDFDKDGRVGPADAAILAAHWGMSRSSAEAASLSSPAAVPEPAALGLIPTALACLLAFRRSRAAQS